MPGELEQGGHRRTGSDQSREAKVFAALLLSMTVCALVLMALGNNPPPAGAFCLNSYYGLEPVNKVIFSKATQYPGRWHCVEVFYSGTNCGNIRYLADQAGLAEPEQINCHFVVCNGRGGADGEIQASERWQKQWSILPAKSGDKESSAQLFWEKRQGAFAGLKTARNCSLDRTIRICVIADGQNTRQTDYQIKRTETLVEQLCLNFAITPEQVYYPPNWR